MKHPAMLVSVLCVLAQLGCKSPTSPSEPSTPARSFVEYTVSGTATRASLTYATSGGGTAQQADRALPWTFSWTANRGDFVYISAQNSGQTGCVSVTITVRSATYKTTQSCGAFVIATASGTVD